MSRMIYHVVSLSQQYCRPPFSKGGRVNDYELMWRGDIAFAEESGRWMLLMLLPHSVSVVHYGVMTPLIYPSEALSMVSKPR